MALIKRIIEMHESSVGHIAGMRRINAMVSGLSGALAHVYIPSIGVVKAMIETMARLGKTVQSLHTARLFSGLLPVLEAKSAEFESAVSGLEPLKVFISRRFTGVIPRIISRPMKELRKLRIPSYERAATIPSTPLVIHPLTLEAMEAIADHISKISEVGRRTYEVAPATTMRVGIDYVGRLLKVTWGVFRRGVKEARSIEAITPRLEVMGAIREFSERLLVPALMPSPLIMETIISRYVVDLSKAGRIPRPVTEKVAEDYGIKVFEPVSKIHKVSRFVGISTFPRARPIEILEASRLLLTILEMGESLLFMTEEAAKAYAVKPKGVAPSLIGALEEGAAEAPVRVAARYAPSIIRISTLAYDIGRRVAEVREVGQKMVEAYRAGAPITWIPVALETSYERAATIPSTPLVIHPLTLEAMEAIADHISKISKVGRRTRDIADYAERISSMVRREVAAFSLSVSAIPSVTEVAEAVPSVRSISEFTSRVTSLRIPVEEGEIVSKYVPAVPETETAFRFIAEKGAETYRLIFLSLISPPVAAITRSIRPVAEEVMKALVFGMAEAPLAYPAAQAIEMFKILSGAVSTVSEGFPGMVKKGYLKLLVEAPPVSEYVTAETKLRMVSEMARSFKLIKGRVKELPVTAPIALLTPSFVEITKGASEYGAVALEMRRAFDEVGVVSRGVMTYRVDVEKAIKSSLGGVVATGLRVSLEGFALGRVLLGGPPSVPTLKLHEIAPILYSVSTPTRTERPIQNVFNITIEERSTDRRFESLSGEVDLRELGRRVARILREEARRYGIHI